MGLYPAESDNAYREFNLKLNEFYEQKFDEDSDSDYDCYIDRSQRDKKLRRKESIKGIRAF